MKKRTKVLITLASIAVVGFSAYSGVWFYYKHNIWQPHIDNATVKLTAEWDDQCRITEYRYRDEETGDSYLLQMPSFGAFDCCVYTSPSYVIDLDVTYIDENREERHPATMGSGSDLGGKVITWLNKNDQIEYYRVVFGPACCEETEKYAEQGNFLIGPDGTLWNEDELSDKEYAIFEDGYSEIMRLIRTLNETYSLEMAPIDPNHPTSYYE